MDRRSFLEKGFEGLKSLVETKDKTPKIQSGIEKYQGTLDRTKAAHLLRRISFAPTAETIDSIVGKNVDEALALVLGDGSEPLPEGRDEMGWIDIAEEDPLSGLPLEIRQQIQGALRSRYGDFKEWWLRRMRDEQMPFMEKLTLFWSTVWTLEFTYDTNALIPPPLIYRNNQTLRKDRLANYKDLAEDITLDGGMLLYQSLHYSTGEAPNENYPRELLELFTMGIGHYSEGDVREAARALTGWQAYAYKFQPAPQDKLFQAFFTPSRHDTGAKTFMGTTIRSRDEAENTEFQVRRDEVRGILDIMFEKRASEIANFVSEKIYRYFVYSSPADVDESMISSMSQIMIDNNFELKPVFEAVLKSQHFYDDKIIGGQFKTPPELIAGFQRQLGVEYVNGNFEKHREAVDNLEQVLYDPPNVGSWIGYRTWISTTTYPLRVNYCLEILKIAQDGDLIALAKKFNGYEDVNILTQRLVEYFLPKEVSPGRLANYKNILLNGIQEQNWTTEIENETANAAFGIRSLIERLIYEPDFQLI